MASFEELRLAGMRRPTESEIEPATYRTKLFKTLNDRLGPKLNMSTPLERKEWRSSRKERSVGRENDLAGEAARSWIESNPSITLNSAPGMVTRFNSVDLYFP